MSEGERRLLWVDDDGPERFEYERLILERKGWEISWARDVRTAARILSQVSFTALVIDQTLPFQLNGSDPDDERRSIWGGCMILRWLRQKHMPVGMDIPANDDELQRLKPLEGNKLLQALIVSAFHDDAVEEATRNTSEIDQEIIIEPKPLDIRKLSAYLANLQ